MQRRHAMPFGAEISDTGVRFALWAPTADRVDLVVDGVEHALPDLGDGWRGLTLAEGRLGSRYGYRVGDNLLVPDPASRFQPDDVHGLSEVVDPRVFAWPGQRWQGRPWEETVLYEVHVGTATLEGSFAALAEKLPELKELGVTAVELMPVAEFPGRRNWGYDGVLPFAPDAVYGRPEDLKRLVARAHALGLMVFLDVVYNHFGPSGNYLHAYARSFFTERHPTPWGAGINVDGEASRPVRDFFIHNALYWIEEFQIDGLRLDAVHAIRDDSGEHLIAELARRIRETVTDREVHLVLENEANEARWLEREGSRPRLHTAQWADDIHNAWHPLLTGEGEGYYEDFADDPVGRLARALAEGFFYQGDPSPHQGGVLRGEPSAHLPPTAFVAFLQNHDQVGNRAFGERLSTLVTPDRLAVARGLFLLAPHIPLLFMGEEWAASAPFLFFVDFESDPALAAAVRDGRRREFARFRAFADPAAAALIPDPTLEASFAASRPDWSETAREPHRGIRAQTQALLALRRAAIEPLLKTGYRRSSHGRPTVSSLDVSWRFEGGTLRAIANFGEEDLALATQGLSPLWMGGGAEMRDAVHLPSWSAAVFIGPAQ